MLGNLLDNACKWGRSNVILAAEPAAAEPARRSRASGEGWVEITVDEAAPGSGLGLAIVGDLAEVYGGSISLDTSPAGGLRARLRLPA